MLPFSSFLLYRGHVYRRAGDYVSPKTNVAIKQKVKAAVAALGGHETGNQIGGYTKLRDGGEPWSVEVVAPVAKLQPSSDMGSVLTYSSVDWCGWVEATWRNQELTIKAKGRLFLDGLCHDDSARLLTDQDLVVGTWDGSAWSWQRDLRG